MKKTVSGALVLALPFGLIPFHAAASESLEEMKVWAKQPDTHDAGATSPVSVLTPEDFSSINIATTEDTVKYEPSLVIRRRFIGDSNGTLGIRGSNMFQTSRSMVFADGVPLHYFLESRWSGAPRWTMVSASEIAQVEVLYGPFSAEYGGNAMGGVVLIETAIPEDFEVHMDGSFFQQDFDAYGADNSLDGFKGFASVGDRIGDWSYYFSYNHLKTEAQPQSFRDTGTGGAGTTPVTGGTLDNNSVGTERYFYGDTGVVDTRTRNYKFKTGYDFGDWSALLNIAYEDRISENTGDTYLRDSNGNPVWSGNVTQDGEDYSITDSSRINENELDRDSLSVGLRLKGQLNSNLSLEANINQFDVLNDESRSSAANPEDPAFDGTGQITDYDDTGWQTAEVKLRVAELGQPGLSMVTGLRWEAYELNVNVYDSENYRAGSKSQKDSNSGGKTELTSGFAQLNYEINPQWNTSFGLRAESWKSHGGYYGELDEGNDTFVSNDVPGRSEQKFSPKFSLGYKPQQDQTIRYSVAKAYRFPIVEELFSQYKAYNTENIANPELKPENGLHHNLMFQQDIALGYVRVNLFQETIKNVIESQTDFNSDVRTFVPVDEVQTHGVEFIVNASNLLIDHLDTRFNITYTKAEITENDPDPSIEGNRYPRMPEWRANLLATYHLTTQWSAALNWQYAHDSYGRLDNTDDEDNVYGAQDGYSRFGAKTTYQINEHYKVGAGIDNITNEIDYVAHPWPGRTLYLNVAADF